MTAAAKEALSSEYRAALEAFLKGGGENALVQANDVGRRAIGRGLGVLDLVAMHQSAAESKELEFLAEGLVPFEMRQRGFQESMDSSRLKGQLVATVSHEFANALSVMQCALIFLQETEGQARDEAKRKHVYDILKTNLKALTFATTNLLNLGRVEAGKFRLCLKRILVRTLLKETLVRMEPFYQRKKLKIAQELPKLPVEMIADPEALMFVISNLLSNAVKYTPEKGRVTIRVARTGDTATVSFQDTGIGIPKAEQEKILKGFYRAENTRGHAEGYGVGLSLTQRILEAHGTTLKLESAVGKGSTFSFTLPACK